MGAEKLIETLNKLLQLHQNLYQVTLQKTEYLKQNDVEKLKDVLKKEQKFVQAVKQIEDERIQLTAQYLGRGQDLTLSACIEKAEGEQMQRFQEIEKDFTAIMGKLRAANELNRELTHQALQFVSLSLDMLMPQETMTNYQRPNGQQSQIENKRRSLFDSQA